jgi:crossover junction endodeoxyribonuclease RuvC
MTMPMNYSGAARDAEKCLSAMRPMIRCATTAFIGRVAKMTRPKNTKYKGNDMILGIDPSLTGTAVVCGNGSSYSIGRFSSANSGDDVCGRMGRIDSLVAGIIEWIVQHDVEAVFIEGYSFGSKCNRELLGEFGGLLRWHLVHVTRSIYEVQPSTLKKFATGKGGGTKDMVAAHLTNRYGVLLGSSDEYDAYALYQLGLVATGLREAENNAQREAADRVMGVAPPKKRTRKVELPKSQ